jgi:2-octaprenyl-6-methoxyphenol hydroxylase
VSGAAPTQGAGTAVDVAIVGGGLVGASLALALAPLGLRTALIESVAPDAAAQPSFDDRTTALGNGTRRTFEALGLWRAIEPHCAPIRRIHVSDAGRFGFARLDAGEQGVEAFGYVVANRALGGAMRARLAGLADLLLCQPARVEALAPGEDAIALTLDDGRVLRARLVVGADGAQSVVRKAAGLPASVKDYGQVALTAHVKTTRAMDRVAYERFAPSGPMALLPLAGGGAGLIWTLAPRELERVAALPDAAFLRELQQAFGWRAGAFTAVGRRTSYPLALTRAGATVAKRTVLIGNSSQALHPVAGQGFNLGLRDAAMLAEVLALASAGMARASGGADDFDAGAADVLAGFAAQRESDRAGITRFTDTLVRVFSDARAPVGLLRDLGLLLFDLSPAAKDALARVSWGFGGRIPRLARGVALPVRSMA